MRRLKPRKVHIINWIMLIAGAVIGLIGVFYDNTPLSCTGIVIMIASIIFRYIFYRCPYCGKYLDRSTGPYCPQCGKKVNE